jgi:hypothetical protein
MSKWEELKEAARSSQATGLGLGLVVMPDAILELLAERDALKAELDRIKAMEPFGTVTVRHARFEHHADQYQFFPAGHPPYLDTADECHVVYTLEKP